MYGAAETVEVTEDSPLAPMTEYARSKVKAEDTLRTMADDNFSPVYIRNGTVYGVSPRMRFDTVLNNFVGQAVASGQVIVFSNGEPWRPVLHVKDVARTFVEYLHAPRDVIHNQAFNNGADHLNYRVRDLAKIAVDTVPGATLEIRGEASADQRSYKASFAKFARTFPNFKFEFDAKAGAKELYETLKQLNVDDAIFQAPEFTRLKWLKQLLDSGQLEEANLRWTPKAVKAA
jgi:nucleoside-diphosphate-sugar epimerase